MHGAKRRRRRRRRRRRAKRGKAMPGTYHFRMERGLQRDGRGKRKSTAAQTAALYAQKLDFFFAHPVSTRRPLHYPLIFCPAPGPSTFIHQSFFFALFSSPFSRRLYILAVRREGQGLRGSGLETTERAKGRF